MELRVIPFPDCLSKPPHPTLSPEGRGKRIPPSSWPSPRWGEGIMGRGNSINLIIGCERNTELQTAQKTEKIKIC